MMLSVIRKIVCKVPAALKCGVVFVALMLCSVGVTSSRFGDVDGDGEITLADISLLINRYLASALKEQGGEALEPADDVTIDDITELIGVYLTGRQDAGTERACVLDMTRANREIEASIRNVYSAEYMLELAGMPSFTTSVLAEALKGSRMIVLSSELKKESFSAAQLDSLYAWVEDGGVLVSPALTAVSSAAFLSGGGGGCRQGTGIY